MRKRGVTTKFTDLQLKTYDWLDITIDEEAGIDLKKISTKLRTIIHEELRYCPFCWNETKQRYFKLIWRYDFVNVCLIHGTPLFSECHSCSSYLFSESSSKNICQLSEKQVNRCWDCNESLTPDWVNDVIFNEYDFKKAQLQKQIIDKLTKDTKWADHRNYSKLWESCSPLFKSMGMDGDLQYINRFLDNVDPTTAYYTCPICIGEFWSQRSFSDHIEICNQELLCPICNANKFKFKREFLIHVQDCQKKEFCRKCKKAFKSTTTYFSHFGLEHESMIPSCPKCKAEFTSLELYQLHRRKCREILLCSVCGAIFNARQEFLTHIMFCKEKSI